MGRIKNLEDATGPNVMRHKRLSEMQTELDGLVRRRDELLTWTTQHVSSPEWEQRMRDLHLIVGRLMNMRQRMANVQSGEPELGHYVGASTPTGHKNLSKPQR